jgi:hypothetical protein
VLFVHDTGGNRRNTLLLHRYCWLETIGRRVEAGLHVELGFTWVLRPKSVEELPSVPNGTRTYALHRVRAVVKMTAGLVIISRNMHNHLVVLYTVNTLQKLNPMSKVVQRKVTVATKSIYGITPVN